MAIAIGIRTIVRVSNCEVIDSSRFVCAYSVAAYAMNATSKAMPSRTMSVFWPAIRPVVGSFVRSSGPMTFRPTTITTKNATMPTSARIQPVAM